VASELQAMPYDKRRQIMERKQRGNGGEKKQEGIDFFFLLVSKRAIFWCLKGKVSVAVWSGRGSLSKTIERYLEACVRGNKCTTQTRFMAHRPFHCHYGRRGIGETGLKQWISRVKHAVKTQRSTLYPYRALYSLFK